MKLALVGGLAVALGIWHGPARADQARTTLSALADETHFHGIAVDQCDPSRIFLATHHGLYAVSLDGTATLVSETRDDFMGFRPHPTDLGTLYASGHPARGGNLGFLTSRDGGRSWIKLSDGHGGPVDFHQMDFSKRDPRVVYGVYRVLQRSEDGGRTWQAVGPPPYGLIDLAASSLDTNALYAATQRGLLQSRDAGKTWQPIHENPATMVTVTPAGDLYAFVADVGLIHAPETSLRWSVLHPGFGSQGYLTHFTVQRDDARRFYAVLLNPESKRQSVVMSRDGGASWAPLGR
jgi:photosystem II stability/assembly factor-like uncharacterized protein